MLKSENIICISSIDWDFNWQGHQEIMSAFAKQGNRVLFIENTGVRVPYFKDIPRIKKRILSWIKSTRGFREESGNLYIFSPIALPFPYSRIARWINKRLLISALRRWIKAMEFWEPIIWTFLPTGTALDIIHNIEKKLLVYYCIADFYELVDNPKKIKKTEDELIKKSDIIFVQGEALAEKCMRINNNVHIFPFGVNTEVFNNEQCDINDIAQDMQNIKKPIIGYIGGIHRHIDFKLIEFLARSHPEWSIVLIGPAQADVSAVANLSNVFLLGKKDFRALPKYIAGFDVGIIPYEVNKYTETVFPTKLNEYHSMGKPVVSMDLPEVASFNKKNNDLVFIAKTYAEFSGYITKVLYNNSKMLEKLRKVSAGRNDWAVKIEEMSSLTEDALKRKTGNLPDWRERFLRFYKLARKRTITAAVIFLSFYLLLFYTPLVWLAAEPLKISHAPLKTDCIVVFAGGVGESGKPGQGYEERVEYAVELYKNGFAPYIVFSSGFTYVFREPLVMKALAVSLGVPEKAIILEDRARNTFENVKFTREILNNRDWNRILLVSSPYHMRRVYLVFNKIAKEIKVVYTPIKKSLFYLHKNKNAQGARIWQQISFQQIKAILHEYLGILYYWSKSYI